MNGQSSLKVFGLHLLFALYPACTGISFFLPNMTWFQPPGYVHIMFSQTWAETTVLASAQAEGPITYIPAPQPGFLADGDDVWSGLATLAQAEALCTTNFSTCVSLNARAWVRERKCERSHTCARASART